MHQAHDTIIVCICRQWRIHVHRFPRNYNCQKILIVHFLWNGYDLYDITYIGRNVFQPRIFPTKLNSTRNHYLEVSNGLQSVLFPCIHVTNSTEIIFQFMVSVFDICILRPTRLNRLWCLVQIMTYHAVIINSNSLNQHLINNNHFYSVEKKYFCLSVSSFSLNVAVTIKDTDQKIWHKNGPEIPGLA